MTSRLVAAALVAATLSLAGCDMLTGEAAKAEAAAKREGDGKAIGGACRHAGRAIEDCYALNRKADRAAVFAGWREMNDYMRENKIDEVPPQLGATEVASGAKAEVEEPAKKADAKPAKKHDS